MINDAHSVAFIIRLIVEGVDAGARRLPMRADGTYGLLKSPLVFDCDIHQIKCCFILTGFFHFVGREFAVAVDLVDRVELGLHRDHFG